MGETNLLLAYAAVAAAIFIGMLAWPAFNARILKQADPFPLTTNVTDWLGASMAAALMWLPLIVLLIGAVLFELVRVGLSKLYGVEP